MNANTNTFKNFIVYREGELDTELSRIYREPNILDKAKSAVNLQFEMALYDALHRTHYRRAYNRIMRDKRNQAFEQRLGLVRVRPSHPERVS